MKIIVSGQKTFGREAAALVTGLGHQLVAVSCPVDREDRLYRYAHAWEIPVIPGGTLSHRNLPGGVDLIIAAHSHDFIGKRTRQKTRLGAIGYHPSLLPRHRGRSAVEWAVRYRDAITGGSVFWLNDTVDGGPVAAQDWCWIHPDDTASSLWRRELFPMGLRLLEKTLSDISRSVLVKVPQNTALATWEPGIEQPLLYRPDLPELEDGRYSGFRTVVEASSVDLARPLPGFIDEHGWSDEDLIGASEMGEPVGYPGSRDAGS